jgi:adenylate kinase family enzyme
LKIYQSLTYPVLDYYSKIYETIKVDALGEIDEINKNILDLLKTGID